MMHRRTPSHGQRGYSLVEMITVVAIVGIFSLVAVPQFMNINRSLKVKASMRQFAMDVRATRQRAITRNRRTAITFSVGLNPSGTPRGAYEMWERNDAGTWGRFASKKLTPEQTDIIYFNLTDFDNATDGGSDVGGDTRPDIVFQGNGTVLNMPAGANARVEMMTDWKIPKNLYRYKFSVSGNFVTESN
jgi:prepilin-type N-terminal cleavage/methylation domain-containing protein